MRPIEEFSIGHNDFMDAKNALGVQALRFFCVQFDRNLKPEG